MQTSDQVSNLPKWQYVPENIPLPPLPPLANLPTKTRKYYTLEDAENAVKFIYNNHPRLFAYMIEFDDYSELHPDKAKRDFMIYLKFDPEDWNFLDQIQRIFLFELGVKNGGNRASFGFEIRRMVRFMFGRKI